MGDPKKPSTWTVAKELAKATVGIGDLPSDEQMVAQEEADAINSPDQARARGALGLPGIIEPTAPKGAAAPTGWDAIGDADHPAVTGDTSAPDARGLKLQSDIHTLEPFAAPVANTHIRPEGFSTAASGGDDIYNTTFEDAPQKSMEAKADLADLQGKRSDALTGFYNEQSQRDIKAAAASKQQASEDQASLQARQQKLDEATQYYTNDLQDQGKFWQNPGNIVSAIAFSLMPIFSNDPTVGVKLINQAIDRDMANRQHAAGQTLGALRSNLDGYHKIAGDRQAGDLLAQAEAHRIAAQQIQQISMSFESPIAKKQAQMAIADQVTRQKAAQMEFNKTLHSDPRVMTPQMDAAYVHGANGFRRGGVAVPLGGVPKPGDGNGPVTGSAVNGTLPGGGGPTTAHSKPVSPTATALANAGGATAVVKGMNKGMISPQDAETSMRSWIQRKAVAEHRDPSAVLKEDTTVAMKQVETAAPLLAKDADARNVIVRLQNRMNTIEALAAKRNADPNDFIGYAKSSGLIPEPALKQYRLITGGDPRLSGNAAKEKAKWHDEQEAHLRQELASAVNQQRHLMSGGAVTPSESGKLEGELSPNMPWRDIKNYLDMKSSSLQSNQASHEAIMGHPLAQVLYANHLRSQREGTMQGAPRLATGSVRGPAQAVQPAADPVTGNPPAPANRGVLLPPDTNNTPELMRRRTALGLPPTIDGDK